MSYSIVWMPKALSTFDGRINYLNEHFTEKEIKNFQERVKEYVEVLKTEPLIGENSGIKNVHIGLIIKEVSLIYRVRPIKKNIELLIFFDNRQNPKKIKKYKA
jgi:plasmid stabilization system protein ParE